MSASIAYCFHCGHTLRCKQCGSIAAQVVEQDCCTVFRNAAIERCAQWLEEDGNHATAKAMREALKDTK